MGKLNIAHHKSYHPYRLDNIERVRRDEEEARLKERGEEDRMRLADSEARLEILRGRSGGKKRVKKDSEEGRGQEVEAAATLNTITTSSGHINLFADVEQRAISDALVRSRDVVAKGAKADEEKGVRLAPSTKDLNPWYSEYEKQKEAEVAEDKRMRDLTWKMHSDPLTAINVQLSRSSTTAERPVSSSRRSAPHPHDDPSDPAEARLQRESSERARAAELIRRKKRERERAALGMASMTPSSVGGGGGGEDLDHRGGYDDVYNRKETEEAHRRWERGGGGTSGGSGSRSSRSSWARSGERGTIISHERRRDREGERDRGYRDRRW